MQSRRPPSVALSTLAAAAALAALTTPAHAYVGSCVVNFDSQFALQNVLAQARNTFANWTKYDANGKLAFCPEGGPSPDNGCWDFRHRCWYGYVNVWPQNYSHFHLGWNTPDNFCFYDPRDGYGAGFSAKNSSNVCVAPSPSWDRTPRELQAHNWDEWIEISNRAQGDSRQLRVFAMPEIGVIDGPIQLWFKKVDGSVWGYSNLPVGNWYIDAYDVVAVWVSGATGQGWGLSYFNMWE